MSSLYNLIKRKYKNIKMNKIYQKCTLKVILLYDKKVYINNDKIHLVV